MSLRYGYVTNGLTGHRLEDALGLLADHGYAGVALTLDHVHLDPLARGLRARAARLRAGSRRSGSPASSRPAGGSCSTRAASTTPRCSRDGRQRRVDLSAARSTSPPSSARPSSRSGPAPRRRTIAASARGTGCSTAASACSRTPSATASRSGSSPSPACSSRRWPTTRRCAAARPPAGARPHARPRPLRLPRAEPVTECVRRGAATLVHVHVEDMRRGVHEHLMFGEGELDLAAALGVLAEVGYAGRSPSSSPGTRTPRTRPCPPRSRPCAPHDGRRCDDDRRSCPPRSRRGPGRRARLAARDERGGRRRPRGDPRPLPDGRAQGRPRAARPRTPTPPTCTRGRSTTRPARCCSPRSATRAEERAAELYRYGDAAERRGLLRALPYLPLGDRALDLVDDAIRTNDTRLIAAALGPYATEHLPDAAYDQAVLKCVFVGVPITPLDGLPERVTPNGARMLAAFVHERVAAGRDVPGRGLARDRPLPARGRARRDRGASCESPFEDRRAAAERALEPQNPGAPHEDLRPPRAHDVAHHRRLRGDGRLRASRRSSSRRSGSASRAPRPARSSTTSTRCSAGSASGPASSASATTARSGSTRRRRTTTRCAAK